MEKSTISLSKLFFALFVIFGVLLINGNIVENQRQLKDLNVKCASIEYLSNKAIKTNEVVDLQAKLIAEQKEFVKTLEEDNRMLYKELYDANQKIMKHDINHSLYSGATIQKAF